MSLRILVSADMEGAAGAAAPSDVSQGTPAWAEVRRCWTEEVNSVLDALFEHGASEVVLVDAHANGCNLEPNLIDPRSGLIRGGPRKFGMLEGIDSGVQGALFLGYHGTAGSGGVLSHAFVSSGIHSLRVNGETAGEGTINSLLAAHFGVPVVLVSGDNVACSEAEHYAPDAQRVVVKKALGRFVAEFRPTSEVRREYAQAVELAMSRLRSAPSTSPLQELELCAEIEFGSEACALAASAIPGVQSVGSRRVSYTSRNVPEWYRCLGAIWTLARASHGGTYA